MAYSIISLLPKLVMNTLDPPGAAPLDRCRSLLASLAALWIITVRPSETLIHFQFGLDF